MQEGRLMCKGPEVRSLENKQQVASVERMKGKVCDEAGENGRFWKQYSLHFEKKE